MSNKNQLQDMNDIGEILVQHAQKVKIEEKRGMVVELYPYIYEASSRMSARSISKFLWDKLQTKVSATSIAKAISDPKRYWNHYFDVIEPFAKTFEKGAYHTQMSGFLFDDEKFEEMTKKLPFRAYKGHWLDLKALCRITVADDEAANILRKKWFDIRMEIRLKAKPFIEHRLGEQKTK
jgi:hypothetical protein